MKTILKIDHKVSGNNADNNSIVISINIYNLKWTFINNNILKKIRKDKLLWNEPNQARLENLEIFLPVL